MKKEEINNFNRMCAEFLEMEFEIHSSTWRYKNEITTELLFHSDWNWIHLMLDKIEKIGETNELFGTLIDISTTHIKIGDIIIDMKQEEYKQLTKKEAVVQAINQFLIKWEH